MNYNITNFAAGPAVFQARDIYALLVDSVLYQDSAKCANAGYARESLIPPDLSILGQQVQFG